MRTLRRARVLLVAALVGASCLAVQVSAATSPAAATPAQLKTIEPGGHPMIHVKTKVNIVFVGYRPAAVDVPRILGQLASSGQPAVRSALVWNHPISVGLQYDYQYSARFAGKAFDDAFFGYLSTAGFLGPLDIFQEAYNEQVHSSLHVGPNDRYIDGPSTEAWLETQAHTRLGIDPAQDTVYLVNWYGRPDFHFHSYTHFGHPDPDTGIDGGFLYTSLTRSWGGTSGPTWFVDLSAGPVYNDVSWNVDLADYTGDGITDYRLPPIWEYGNTAAYRPFTDLSGDLGLVIRYVAVNALFTSSPEYDPAASVPGPQSSKQIALDIFEGDPNVNGLDDVHLDAVRALHQSLEPYYSVTTTLRDYPLAGASLAALNGAIGLGPLQPCNETFPGFPEGALFCFFRDHRAQYFPSSAQNAVIPVAGYTVPSDAIPGAFNFQGVTDDDWSTGKPSYIYEFDTPIARVPFGVAYTHLTTHEVGHFVGLSHPHDAYDPTTAFDYVPVDAQAFMWMGDETDTAMSYLHGQQAFSVFDRGNLARWQVGRLLQLADTDAAAILAAPPNATEALLLAKADGEFTAAVKALHGGAWIDGATAAVNGYRDMQRADNAAGVVPAAVAAAAAVRETSALTAHVPYAVPGESVSGNERPGASMAAISTPGTGASTARMARSVPASIPAQ